jgi:hypothetical protein
MRRNKYITEIMSFTKLRDKIDIPRFQRTIVWTQESKEKFIKTVSDGYPFGSLLVYDSENKLTLIDGLQRYSTLLDFERNPLKYIKIHNTAQAEFNDAFNFLNSITEEFYSDSKKNQFYDIFRETFEDLSSQLRIENFINAFLSKLSDRLVPELNGVGINKQNAFRDVIQKILDELKSVIDLSTLEIPVIKFSGDKNDLPTIFENMNSNGTALSKYEIFAAVWNKSVFEIEDEEILDRVDRKYQEMINRSKVEIENYTVGSIKSSREINLFEYCYAVGKLIIEKCNFLFGSKSSDDSQVDSVGFSLVTSVLGIHLREVKNIYKYFEKLEDTKKMTSLKNAIIECAKEVENYLEKFLKIVDGKVFYKYSELQAISFVTTLFRIRYNLDIESLNLSKNTGFNYQSLLGKFQKQIHFHYFYDMIRNHWSGTGDNKLYDDMKQNIDYHRYTEVITRNSWQQLLAQWLSEQERKKSSAITEDKKIFLLFITRETISKYNYKKFDFEHCVPKDSFNHEKFKDQDIPLSAIGNLCIFPAHENRSKKEMTIYQMIDSKLSVLTENQTELSDFHYPSRAELEFVGSNEFNMFTYKEFIRKRHEYYINQFLDQL